MAVPVVPELDFSEFSAKLRAGQNRIPLYGSIETTFRCNLNCVHCYVNEPLHAQEVRSRELSLHRLLRLLDEIADQGCLELLLTGGEVLARPDFPDLYKYAVRKGFRVTVFTNGTLVTENIVRLFKAFTPACVEITLYGMTADTYERITRVTGSFGRCLRGIMRLHGGGMRLRLKAMVMSWNEHELPMMKAFAQKLGVGFRHDGLLNPRVDGLAGISTELHLSADRMVAVDLDDPSVRQRQQESAASLFERDAPHASSDQLYSCGAGRVTFNVDPYGSLQLCQLSRRPFFDLREDSFVRGWNEFLAKLLTRCRSQASVCRGCTLLPMCGSCPGACELEHGDPERPVERFCEITHLRAHTLLGEIPGHQTDASCCLGRWE